jgi:hypothetical protein
LCPRKFEGPKRSLYQETESFDRTGRRNSVRASKKKRRTELQNLCTFHTIKVRRNRIVSWLIIDDAMADDEEPLDHLLDDPDLEHF